MILSDQTYNTFKWAVTIVLPALAALYSGLAILWGFPLGEEVVGSISLVAAFMGTVIGISAKNYNAVSSDPDQPSAGVPPEERQ